jgi:hypothetical protein
MELFKSNKYGSRLPKRPPCKETITFFRVIKTATRWLVTMLPTSCLAGAQMSRGGSLTTQKPQTE